MSQKLLVPPKSQIDLAKISTKAENEIGRDEAEHQFTKLREELIEWQYRWYAEGKRRFLIVLQAMDTGGKDGVIRHVFQGVNPQGVDVTSFKSPTPQELAQDYLWRIHQAVPYRGMIGIFNRSHYEDVLIVRVLNLVSQEIWQTRYEQINQFERYLYETDTTILKFYLHISKDEQRERLQARIDTPDKRWKFDSHDLVQRKHWDEYMEAYQTIFEKCSTEYAPWYIIPSDQKWYRNYAIAKILVKKFRELDPQYPQPTENLDQYVVE